METAKRPQMAPERFENGAPMLVVGFNERYTFDRRFEIPAQWERFVPVADTIPGRIGNETFGMVSHAPEGFDYMTGVYVRDGTEIPAGLDGLSVPARRYAVFAHRGHVSTLPRTLDAIWGEWLPASGHEIDGSPEIAEVYGEEFDPQTGSGIVELWVPVKT